MKEISFGLFFGMDTKARVVYRINMLCYSVCFLDFGFWILDLILIIYMVYDV